jgi:hypothetical protein
MDELSPISDDRIKLKSSIYFNARLHEVLMKTLATVLSSAILLGFADNKKMAGT